MSKKPTKRSAAQRRIEVIQRQIAEIETLCSGTLHKRTKVCGKPTCKCATDPRARHGPYYEWSRLEGRRLRHTLVSEAEAPLLTKAIENRRKVIKLLKRWEESTLAILLPRVRQEAKTEKSGNRKKRPT